MSLGNVRPLGHDQLPEQLAGGLVEALDQPALRAAEARIVGHGQVVGAHEDPAAGDGRIAVGGGAEPGDPLHVLGGGRIDAAAVGLLLARGEAVGQAAFRRRPCCGSPCRPTAANRRPGQAKRPGRRR